MSGDWDTNNDHNNEEEEDQDFNIDDLSLKSLSQSPSKLFFYNMIYIGSKSEKKPSSEINFSGPRRKKELKNK